MKKHSLLFLVFFCTKILDAQNVGIGTTTPAFPLSFSNELGDKIALWGSSGFHYGFGVQNGLLQIHSDVANGNIAFGYGSSNNFTERMRILNNGNYDGMILNGRLVLKNGSTDIAGGGAGVWMYKANNTALLGFMGAQNNQNVGFYGGPAGWGFTYDAINSRVGIGNNNPNAPLAFAAALGKKITLYPGATGDAGFGMAGNRLQIYSDNPNADVAIGYDAAGTFNEKFAVKPTGAIALSTNTGVAGQSLTTNGNGAGAYWSSPGIYYYANQSSNVNAAVNQEFDLPGMTANFTLTTNAQVVFQMKINYNSNYCLACNLNRVILSLYKNVVGGSELVNNSYGGGHGYPYNPNTLVSGPIIINLSPGTYSFKTKFRNSGDEANELGSGGQLVWQIFPF